MTNLLKFLIAAYMLNATFQIQNKGYFYNAFITAIYIFLAYLIVSLFSKRWDKKIPSVASNFTAFLICLFSAWLSYRWGVLAPVEQFSDFNSLRNHAFAFTHLFSLADLYRIKSAGLAILSFPFIYLLGENTKEVQMICASIFFCNLWLLFIVLKKLTNSPLFSLAGLLSFALYPGTIMFSQVFSTEMAFAFFFLAILITINSSYKHKYLFSGVLSGLLFITRSTGIATVIAIIISILFHTDIKRSLPKLSKFFTGISIILFSQLALNLTQGNEFSFSSSQWGSYNLMVGTNQKYNGSYNREDLSLAGFDKLPHSKASENAKKIAIERIAKSPYEFMKFALTTKVGVLWETDSYTIYKGIPSKNRKEFQKRRGSFTSHYEVLNPIYFGIIFSSILALILSALYRLILKKDTRNKFTLSIISLSFLGIAGLHLFVEVQARYHNILLLCLFMLITCSSFELREFLFKTAGSRLPKILGRLYSRLSINKDLT